MKLDSFLKKKDTKVAEEQAAIAEEPVAEETKQSIKSKSFSFTELAYQEHNSHVEPLKQEIESLEKQARELWDTIESEKKKNADTRALREIHKRLGEELRKKRNELPKIQVEYEVDFQLKMLASELDRLEGWNVAVNLYKILGHKINDLVKVILQIENCHGGEFYAAPALIMIKDLMPCIVSNYNMHLAGLRQKDRKELEKKFFDRFENLKAESERIQEIKEKYEGQSMPPSK